MQQLHVSETLCAYQEDLVDIQQSAERARLSVAALLEEMAHRKVVVIETPEAFGSGLAVLCTSFGENPTVPSET
jgi:hypothetical protein